MTDTNNIFTKFLASKPIFSNRDALTISFKPETIPHREKQVNDLGRILAPALKGGRPSNIFLYGRPGTGKTLVSRFVGSELEKISGENGQSVKVMYVNCKMKKIADTEYRLLAELSKALGKEVPFTGLPTDQVYNAFFDALDSRKQTIILIVDEIDTLVQKTGDEILYNLTRINQDLNNSKLSIIGITNNLGFIETLDPRVKSSLSEEELIFPPYNALQLQDILKNRASIAFTQDVLQPGVIEKCAALAAQEHGDARRALDLLRVAGELSERNSHEKVSIEHVDDAEEKIDVDRVVETVKSMPKQSQIVLYSIVFLAEKTKEIQTGEVFDKYQEICKQQGIKTLTTRRVSDLISELDLSSVISTKIVSKGRYGRTRVISLNLSDTVYNKLKNLLEEIFL
ncbi:MAG: ORC1-type DNA replication protein [Candidatus Aenigmarchaeota archaeon]|nr:ORC1-type DNA replication protein [Candidatus Aenigmarchaeota archaeon]